MRISKCDCIFDVVVNVINCDGVCVVIFELVVVEVKLICGGLLYYFLLCEVLLCGIDEYLV